jgi:hypothetical protein
MALQAKDRSRFETRAADLLDPHHREDIMKS